MDRQEDSAKIEVEDDTLQSRVRSWVRNFGEAMERGDVDGTVEMFEEGECFWRDLLAFTWNIDTAESRQDICCMLHATLQSTQPRNWELLGDAEGVPGSDVVQCFVTFETQFGRCKGVVKLRGVVDYQCWCLLTTLQELKGHEERAGPRREVGVQHGSIRGRKSWLERRTEELQALGSSRQPYCLIVGGGQNGIVLGARLRRLGVPAIIVEKNACAGDSWRQRYKSLCVHTPVWYDHLPYIPFPDHWPKFASKDQVGDWLEAYTLAMDLVYWASTECKAARFDDSKQRWEVKLLRKLDGTSPNKPIQVTLYPTHLVLATGMSGSPNVPDFPGARDVFQGTQYHSSQFRAGDQWAGKHCVIIGSNNSAHDICAHLWESAAASVTMVQRSPTHIFPSDNFVEVVSAAYLGKHSTAEGDLLLAALPYKLLPQAHIPVASKAGEEHVELYKELEKVGFMHTFGEDGSGMIPLYLRRGSGYYIDVGATELVRAGKVKLKSRVEVVGLSERGVQLSDGSEVEADLVVYATGYKPMNDWAARLISEEVAGKVGLCWGLGSNTVKDPGPWQRELRNMWKPTPQANLWFHGGGFHEARHYSLYLALQIKARMEHIPTPVFRFPPIYSSSL
ncbi:hypothetical protein GOP47_0002487 [Adiantum capillus-veneris]|uniref:Flavin-containing monooxygenase n=1 Tax=Adiantum capillus-veneris TaxID=13818 RepID=A0A9D4VB07_ADICA|nr:hypothetical protein GOP47_0002487 [Adiantum capillus-veneris]